MQVRARLPYIFGVDGLVILGERFDDFLDSLHIE
jgi:hypothetical protein